MLWVLKRDSSFEHLKHMLKIGNKKYLQFFAENFAIIILTWTFLLNGHFAISPI